MVYKRAKSLTTAFPGQKPTRRRTRMNLLPHVPCISVQAVAIDSRPSTLSAIMRTGRVQGPSTSLRTKSPLQSRLCLQPRSLSDSADCISRTPTLLDSLSMPIAFSKWLQRGRNMHMFSVLVFYFHVWPVSFAANVWFHFPGGANKSKRASCMHAHIHPTHGRACAVNICVRVSHPTYFCLYIHSNDPLFCCVK